MGADPACARLTSCWVERTPYDEARYRGVTELRRSEQAAMAAFGTDGRCLMRALQEELDDPAPQDCGRCSVCTQPRYDGALDPALVREAIRVAEEYVAQGGLLFENTRVTDLTEGTPCVLTTEAGHRVTARMAVSSAGDIQAIDVDDLLDAAAPEKAGVAAQRATDRLVELERAVARGRNTEEARARAKQDCALISSVTGHRRFLSSMLRWAPIMRATLPSGLRAAFFRRNSRGSMPSARASRSVCASTENTEHALSHGLVR